MDGVDVILDLLHFKSFLLAGHVLVFLYVVDDAPVAQLLALPLLQEHPARTPSLQPVLLVVVEDLESD